MIQCSFIASKLPEYQATDFQIHFPVTVESQNFAHLKGVVFVQGVGVLEVSAGHLLGHLSTHHAPV